MKKTRAVGTVPKSNRIMVERGKLDISDRRIFVTAHCPGLAQALQ